MPKVTITPHEYNMHADLISMAMSFINEIDTAIQCSCDMQQHNCIALVLVCSIWL